MRICGGEGDEKFLKVTVELRALLEVGGMGFLDSIDIDNCKSVLGAEGKSGGLDATIAVGSMVGAVERHDGGGAKKCDCFVCKYCSVVILQRRVLDVE